jgi:protein-S-isoprenylcysteine O-methyltransferase Ste14
LLAYLINPRWMAWSQVGLPPAVRWAGAALSTIAVPLLFWMFRSLGGNVTDTVAIRREHRLVTAGPYRWIRHPLYSFGSLLLLGFSLLSASWFIAGAALVAAPFLVSRTRTEEARLLERFGDDYRAYIQHTGRFLPRLKP